MVTKYFILINTFVIYFVYGLSINETPTKVAGLTNDNSISRSSSLTSNHLKREDLHFDNPPPEYYKGPTTSNSILDNRDRDRDRERDRERNGFISRPDPVEHRYNGGGGVNVGFTTSKYGNNGNTYESRYPQSGYGGIGNRDRINYGHYGNTGIGTYDNSRPTLLPPLLPPPPSPYGPPRPIDLPGGNGYHHGFTTYEIPDNNIGHGLDWGQNGYGNGGNHWGEHGFQLTKANLLPIAGAALLGIAAALVANPVLLQLGVIPGKRKKRDINHSQKLAYKSYQNKYNKK